MKRLDKIAENYSEEKGFDIQLQKYKIQELTRFVKGKSLLDVGCGIGMTTKALSPFFNWVTGIDGSEVKIAKANQFNSDKKIRYLLTLFEKFQPEHKFDMIICTNVLEHMKDTQAFLRLMKSWLNRKGRLAITVPNALALHKLLAQNMGVTKNLYRLTAADKQKGHYVIFDKNSLESAVRKSGFRIFHSGGILLKPLPNNMMENIPDNVVDGFYELGKDFQGYCSSLIVVADLP